MKQKDLSLEAVRGLAALVVVACHIALGFFPQTLGYNPEIFGHTGLRGTPLFAFLNGSSAVAVFFVLSGYVLSKSFFEKHDRAILARASIKRWFRLLGPVLLSCLFSYAIFSLNLYHFNEAADITRSTWLKDHLFNGADQARLSWFDAAWQGATTFFTGKTYYNTPIWTMRPEFLGSYVVFALALVISFFRFRTGPALALLIAALVCALLVEKQIGLFVLGVGLGFLTPRLPRLTPLQTFVMIVIALYLLGFTNGSVGAYSLFPSSAYVVYICQAVGSVALVAAVELSKISMRPVFRPAADYLGRLSFPIYLVRIPILCSLGSICLVQTKSAILAGIMTLMASLIVGALLASFNDWWTKLVDDTTHRLVPRVSLMANAMSGQPISAVGTPIVERPGLHRP